MGLVNWEHSAINCEREKGKQIQTSLKLISVSLSNVLYCIYDVSVVSRCTLYLNKYCLH